MTLKVPYTNFPTQFQENRTAILKATEDVFTQGHFILGEQVELFEKEFAKLCGIKHAISVANGTDALILALKTIGLKEGDEVIVPPNSWVSTASSVALLGGRPVFADVNTDLNISPKKIEEAITKKTKAIMPVHLTGRCADMPAISAIAKKYNLPIIEDAAQAVTASIDGIKAGAWGLLNCFSLHPLKNLNAAGDAGVITTQDDSLAEQLLLLRNHGQKKRDEVVQWGYNSRLDTLQAAILLTRVAGLGARIEKRRGNAHLYQEYLGQLVECPVEKKNEYHTFHTFIIKCDGRDQLMALLRERGIGTKIHYPTPIHLQQAATYLGYKKGSLPETERQAGRILSLPVHEHLTTDQIGWVCESIKAFYK